ncbi:hypothetical protein ACKWTF_013027 [Chironomus riparius]
MDALHNSNECFAIFYSHTIPWHILFSTVLLNDVVGWLLKMVRGNVKEKALICMQISIYPISAHFHCFDLWKIKISLSFIVSWITKTPVMNLRLSIKLHCQRFFYDYSDSEILGIIQKKPAQITTFTTKTTGNADTIQNVSTLHAEKMFFMNSLLWFVLLLSPN